MQEPIFKTELGKSIIFILSIFFLSILSVLAFNREWSRAVSSERTGKHIDVNSISLGGGNVLREVLDLQTFGNSPIEFKRLYRSRHRNYSMKAWEFGVANTWQHNWAWELKDIDSKHNGFHDVRLNTPEGTSIDFEASDGTGMIRSPGPNLGDRLYQWRAAGEKRNGHTLVTPEGLEYYFERRPHPNYVLVGMRDTNGQVWRLEYDKKDRLIKIQNQFERFINLERKEVNGVERITKVKSNDGREVLFEYGSFKTNTVLKSVIYPGREKAHYTYVGGLSLDEGRPLLVTADDPMVEGTKARLRWVYHYQPKFDQRPEYTMEGMVKEERNLLTDELIVSVPLGNGCRVVEGDGTVTSGNFFYGLLMQQTDGEGRWEKIFYTQGKSGYVSKRLYPNGAEINYERDAHGRIIKQTDPLGNSRSYTYNANGFLLTSTDSEGRTTTIERNEEDLPIKKTYPDGTTERWTYNKANQILTHTARNGGVTTHTYYDNELGGQPGDLKIVTDALSNITAYTYDAAGNILTKTDALNRTTTYSYDWRGKLLTITYPDNNKIVKTYDAYGNLIKKQNEQEFITAYTYDKYNRLKTIIDPKSGSTTYAYGKTPACEAGGATQKISKVIDSKGKETHCFYDNSGNSTQQITSANSPSAATTIYKYDSVNNLIEVTEPNGNKIILTCDLNHNFLSRVDSPGHTNSYTYDKVGNLKTATKPDGLVTSYDYDSMDRLIKITNSEGDTLKMFYDASDNLEKLIDFKEKTYTYDCDLLNRRTALTYPDNSKESWEYDKVGKLKTYTTRNGQIRTYTHDLRLAAGYAKIILSEDSVLGNKMAYIAGSSNQQILVSFQEGKIKSKKLNQSYFPPVFISEGIVLTNPYGKIFLYDDELNLKQEFDLKCKGAISEMRRINEEGTLLLIHGFFKKQGEPAQFEALTLSIKEGKLSILKKQKIPFRGSLFLHRGKIFLLGKEPNEMMVL